MPIVGAIHGMKENAVQAYMSIPIGKSQVVKHAA